ncbi:MAG: hypothetical protein ACLPHP_24280 [Candidatus Sulfotelmatobacter sp.]
MKISYRITLEDFIDAQKLHRSKSPKALVRAVVLIGKMLVGVSVLVLIVLAAVDRDRKLWSDLAPLIILLALWSLALLVWVPSTGVVATPRTEGCSRNSPPTFLRMVSICKVWILMQT